MVRQPSRRSLLACCASSATAVLAGCQSVFSQPATHTEPPTESLDAEATLDWTAGDADAWPLTGSDPGESYAVPDVTAPTAPEREWEATLESNVVSEPVVRDGSVYSAGVDSVVAFDAATGEPRWRVDKPDNGLDVEHQVVTSNSLYTGHFGVRTSDGAARWTKPASEPAYTDMRVTADLLISAHVPQQATKLAPDTGTERFEYDVGYAVAADGVLYGRSESGDLVGVDAITANTTFERALEYDFYQCVVADGVVCVTAKTVPDNDVFLYAFDVASGEQLVDVDVPVPIRHAERLAFDGTTVYLLGENLHAYDVRSGTKRWTYSPDAPGRTRPVVSARGIHFGTADGLVTVSREGERQWRRSISAQTMAAPTVTASRIYVQTPSRLIAFS